MQVCPIHDVRYPDDGSCWCCDANDPVQQEKRAQAALAEKQSELDKAKALVESLAAEVKEHLQAAADRAEAAAKAAESALASAVGDAAGNAVTNSN